MDGLITVDKKKTSVKCILGPICSPIILPATAVKTNVRALVTGTANDRSANTTS